MYKATNYITKMTENHYLQPSPNVMQFIKYLH